MSDKPFTNGDYFAVIELMGWESEQDLPFGGQRIEPVAAEIHRLQQQAAQQAATISQQKNEFNLMIDLSNSRLKEIQDQAATISTLSDALEKYGCHGDDCHVYGAPVFNDGECTCGFSAAKA